MQFFSACSSIFIAFPLRFPSPSCTEPCLIGRFLNGNMGGAQGEQAPRCRIYPTPLDESYTLSFTRNHQQTQDIWCHGVGNVGDFQKLFSECIYTGVWCREKPKRASETKVALPRYLYQWKTCLLSGDNMACLLCKLRITNQGGVKQNISCYYRKKV